MKVYISGKISGLPTEQVKEKFAQAELQVTAYGHEPVNPLNNGLDEDAPWREQMAVDVAMLLQCDGIYMLQDWNDSPGARIEANIAAECGMEVMHQPIFAKYSSKL